MSHDILGLPTAWSRLRETTDTQPSFNDQKTTNKKKKEKGGKGG